MSAKATAWSFKEKTMTASELTDLVLDLVVMVLFGVALGATIFFNL